jgi:WD40 repeat protein
VSLRSFRAPDEAAAEERAWRIVRTAFAGREPLPAPRRRARPLLVAAAVAALVAGALSSQGEAVLRSVREALGVERAQPALFALPTGGRILVTSDSGPWIVQADGEKRLLAGWRQASWSPGGHFVVVARSNELATLDPRGRVRWTLSRPRVALPRWGGGPVDTRIAYLTGSRLHVVAGDGTGDVAAGTRPAAARVGPAWWHGKRHVLAYADTRGRIVAYDAGSGAVLWRARAGAEPRALEWARDGHLLVRTAAGLELRGQAGQRIWRSAISGVAAASFSPDGRRIAVLRDRELLVLDARHPGATRRVFAGAGPFAGMTWSPDGKWLLVTWPSADQWLFVRVAGQRRIVAVSNVTRQFGGGAFPSLAGWCCSSAH